MLDRWRITGFGPYGANHWKGGEFEVHHKEGEAVLVPSEDDVTFWCVELDVDGGHHGLRYTTVANVQTVGLTPLLEKFREEALKGAHIALLVMAHGVDELYTRGKQVFFEPIKTAEEEQAYPGTKEPPKELNWETA